MSRAYLQILRNVTTGGSRRLSSFAFPKTHRAVVIKAHGDSSVLSMEEDYPLHFRSSEDIADDEVVIQHSYAGLNFIDTYYRSGLYKQPLPFVGGGEIVGKIVYAGEDAKVGGAEIGMRVGCMNLGAYCEYSKLKFDQCVQIPDEVTDAVALSSMIQGLTAHYLIELAQDRWLNKDDWCVVHAGAGGTGSLLVQLAKLKGFRVLSTSSKSKVELAKKCGADIAVCYDELQEAVLSATNGSGAKAVFDGVGAKTAADSLDVCAPRGIVIFFGNASGPVPPVDPLKLVPKSLFITRPKLGDYIATKQELQRRADEIFEWIRSGSLQINTDKVFDLKDARLAHEYIEAGKTTGKVLIKI